MLKLKKQLYTLSLLFLSLTLFFNTQAQSTIAQVSTTNTSISIECYNADVSDNTSVGQTFKSLVTTTMTTIQFQIYNIISAGTIDVEVYSCSGATTWGSLLGTKANVSVSASGLVSVDVSGLNLSVTAGNYYGFRLVPHTGFDANLKIDDNVYADGGLWVSNFAFGNPADLTFTVSGNTTLPVSLVSFTSKQQNDHLLLQWSTASEQNSKDFIVQHSTDGKNWNDIGTLPAAGNSNSIINYSYTHTNPITGINYYRLLQTDLDGKSSFSEIKTVNFSNNNKVLIVLSNPVQSNQLRIQLTEKRVVSVFTTGGHPFWKKELLPGLYTIDVSSCSKGIYFVQAGTLTERIIIQ